NGQKYTLKTNKKGEYFSLGVAPGNYIVTLYKNADDAKANKELFHFNKFQVQLDENVLDFDLKKQAEDTANGQGLTPEQIKQTPDPQKDPNATKTLAAYYNNLAEAYAKSNKTDDAIKTYALAAQADPTNAAQYYFNTGAVCTNTGKVDDAIAAFDKVIAVDPNRADA